MPAWSFHIKLATDISNTLNLNSDDENLFILANLIPDIKSGFLLPVEDVVLSQYSHYYIYENELSLPDLKKYKEKYWNKNDIVSTGVYCHLLLDYYLNNLLKEDYFIFNENNNIIAMKSLNGIFYGNKDECIKFKHKNFNLIAKSLNVKSEFSFPKRNISVETDDGIYIVTPEEIEMTEKWIFDNYKDSVDKFPENELFTEEDMYLFFKNSLDFVLKNMDLK